MRAGGRARDLTITLVDASPEDVSRSQRPADPTQRADRPQYWPQSGLPVFPRHSSDDRPHEVGAAYVCLADEAEALAAALGLYSELPATPVLLRLERAGAFADLVRLDAPTLRVFSMGNSVLTPEVLLDTTTERIARSLHDTYRRHAPPDDPSAVPWDRLPPQLVASNRAQAEHVADKIRASGRAVIPDDGDPPDGFTEAEIDHLGKMEHRRWVDERLAAGWTPGPRNPQLRTSPYLLPWEELSEDVREIDRQFIRSLPDVLTDAGLVLRRSASAGQLPSSCGPSGSVIPAPSYDRALGGRHEP
jgi:hypothetical protein